MTIEERMKRNSEAWHTADAATKKKLEAENQRLGAQLGASYNSKSGKWDNLSYDSKPAASSNRSSGNQSTNIDYSNVLRDLLGNNPGNYNDNIVSKVQQNYDARNAKIANNPELSKYANDDIMMAAQSYLQSAQNYKQTQDALMKMQDAMNNMQYEDPYANQKASALSNLMNRKDFEYNFLNDPAYQAYANQYQIQGNRAMQDTLADAAGNTGGLASSAAVSAAAQAKNNWNSNLNNVIPSLLNAAYQRYQSGIDTDMNVLGALDSLGDSAYGQFADQRDTAMQSAQWLANYGYNAQQDDKAWQYQASRDKVLDAQWMSQFSAEEKQNIIDNAIKNRQISVSEGNLALNKAEYEGSDTSYYGGMYAEMMASENPEQWLLQNASKLTAEEIEWLRKQLESNTEGVGFTPSGY